MLQQNFSVLSVFSSNPQNQKMKRSSPPSDTKQQKFTKIDFEAGLERQKKQRNQEIAKEFRYEVSSIILNFGLLISNFESDLNLAIRHRLCVRNYQKGPKDFQDLVKADFERLQKFYQARSQRAKLTANCKSTTNSENPWEFKLQNLGKFAYVIVSSGIISNPQTLKIVSEDGHSISFSNSDQEPDTVSFGFTPQPRTKSEAHVFQNDNGYSISYTLTTDLEKQTIRSSHIFTNKESATKIVEIYCSEFQKMLSFVSDKDSNKSNFTCYY
jgi:hypothetical protein